MFRIVNRLIQWTGKYKRRIYIGFTYAFIHSIFTAIPIMLAAKGLSAVLDDWGGVKPLEGRDIWICGGADIVNQLIDRRLIDRYHLTIIPTILGSGLRLFGTRDEEQRLRLVSTETYNGMTDLVFEPREPL